MKQQWETKSAGGVNEVKAAFDDFASAQAAKLAELEKKWEARFNRQDLGAGGELRGPPEREKEAKAFSRFMRTGDDSELRLERRELEQKGMFMGNDTAGGYVAPPAFADAVYSVGAEQGVIRKLARRETPSTDDFSIPIAKNLVGAQWVNETGLRGETPSPDFANVRFPGGGIYANVPVTNWILNDSKYDLDGHVIQSTGEQFGVSESVAFVSGSGISCPRGFLTEASAAVGDATRPFGTIEHVAAGGADFDFDDLIDLIGKLAPRYRKDAAFVMNPDTETYVRKLKNPTTDQYLWQASVQAGMPATLLGYPCHVDVNMPGVSAGTIPIAFADWRRFYVVTDVGPTLLLRDPLTKKGHTLFYSERRVGGGVLDSNAGKFLKLT